ncbi:MAG: putative transposase [Comamonadaceae bacterium]|nr:MAG: putative transposase [Comamonadaceae bacterium]
MIFGRIRRVTPHGQQNPPGYQPPDAILVSLKPTISNERIGSINKGEVAFTVRANDKGGKRLHRMEGSEFVRRFLLHVLPTGVKRIRHYGVLASSCKGKKLKAARLALQMPGLNPLTLESAQAFMARVSRMDVGMCPVCKVGHLRTVEVLAGARQLPVPGAMVWPLERGPP